MTSWRSCLSQLSCGTELWLTVVQQKLFNVIPHFIERCCKLIKFLFLQCTFSVVVYNCIFAFGYLADFAAGSGF
jgi:hypothetical protein